MKDKAREVITTFYNLINSPEFNDKFIDEVEWGYPHYTREQIKEKFKDITIWGDDFVSVVSEELDNPDEGMNLQNIQDILSFRGRDVNHDLTHIVDEDLFMRLINLMIHETNNTQNVICIRMYIVKDEDFHGDYYVEAYMDMDYNLFAFGFGD